MTTRKSNWQEFIKDFGDAIGGVAVGYAIATQSFWYGIVGVILIMTSIYIRFYTAKT